MTDAYSYSAKDMTRWYHASIKPARVGLYRIEADVYAQWAYWNGEFWGFRCFSPEAAYAERNNRTLGPIYHWRGLKKNPAPTATERQS